MGYTPVFDSVFTGPLCGKWPDTGLWVCLLAMADKNGIVDKTPQYISAVVGIPVADLTACIERFMQPDPHSRSGDEDGRRLALLEPSRPWGWRIVNHGKYRERARLAAKSAREVESGENCTRMSDRRRPPETAADPLSNANTDSNKEKRESAGALALPAKRSSKFCPRDFQVTADLMAWAATEAPGADVKAETEKFRDHEFKTPRSDWPRAWRNWMRRASESGVTNGNSKPSSAPRLTAYERSERAMEQWARERGIDPSTI